MNKIEKIEDIDALTDINGLSIESKTQWSYNDVFIWNGQIGA
jgi:hypothetical protein